MNVMFRIKSKSRNSHSFHSKSRSKSKQTLFKPAQKTKNNHYLCLNSQTDKELLWKQILNSQIDMKYTVSALQNVDMTMQIDAQKKLLLRRTFLLRKSIIDCIQKQDFDDFVEKVRNLKEMSVQDQAVASLYLQFYEIREKIRTSKGNYSNQTISYIKKEILPRIQKCANEKNNVIYTRIIYILALHLVKLDNVLLEDKDQHFVVSALNSKKKQLSSCPPEQFQSILESLLFLTFEFYRVLHLLKKNQDLILQYYNEICIYIEIFKTKLVGFQDFESKTKIESRVKTLIPINLNLRIYEDHDRRRVLSFHHSKEELLSTRTNHQAIALQNKQDNNRSEQQSQSSNQDTNSQKLIENIDILPQKLQNPIQQQTQIKVNKFNFDFILPSATNVFLGKFRIQLHNNNTKFSFTIMINDGISCLGRYQIREIDITDCQVNHMFVKRVWKIVNDFFNTDKTEFLTSLFSFDNPPIEYLPVDIATSIEFPVLIRIHAFILHYLRKQKIHQKINGNIIIFPKGLIQNNKFHRSKLEKRENNVFSKRLGFIGFNKKILKNKSKSCRIVCLIRQLSTNYVFYGEINEHFFDYVQLKAQNRDNDGKKSTNFMKRNIKICQQFQRQCLQQYRNRDSSEIEVVSRINFKMRQLRLESLHLKDLIKLTSRLQSEIYQDHLHRWIKQVDIAQNLMQIKFTVEEEYEPTLLNFLEEHQDKIVVHRTKVRRYSKSIRKHRIVCKIGNKLWNAQQESLQSHIRIFDSKNMLLLPHNLDQSQLIFGRFRIYKMIYCLHNDSTIKYYLSNKSNNSALQQHTQSVQLKLIRTLIRKLIQSDNPRKMSYYFINIFQQVLKRHTVIQIYSFCDLKLYYVLLSGEIEPMTLSVKVCNSHKKQLIINSIHKMQEHSGQKSNNPKICTAQEYYNKKMEIHQKQLSNPQPIYPPPIH